MHADLARRLKSSWSTLTSHKKARRNRRRASSFVFEPLEQRLALTVFTVTNTSASASVAGSLPYEVAQANKSTDEAIVEFAQAAGQKFATHQTITLTSTLTLDHASESKIPISIVGPDAGLTISGGGSGSNFSVITVTDGTQQAAIKGASASGPIVITNGNLTSASASGAGIDLLGDLVLDNVAVTNNKSAGNGGGVGLTVQLNVFSGDLGSALLASATTFSGNKAAGAGGAIDMEGTAALIVNSTFANNTAGTTGGAINDGPMAPFLSFEVPLNLGVVNDTISGNTATQSGGGIDNANGGIIGLLNAVVAGNKVGSKGTDPDVNSGGSNAVYSFSSHNLIGNGQGLSGSGISDGSHGNVVGHPALLAPLGNYGGANASGKLVVSNYDLQTFALLPGSPAINDAYPLATLQGSVSSSATTIVGVTQLPVPPLDGSTFPYQQGQVILIGSEQMLVTGVTTPSQGTYDLTVTRGVNGTKAAAHNNGATLFLPDERGVFSASNAIGSFQTKGFTVTVDAGDNPQSTMISTAFGNPLGVTVKANDPNAPVNGGVLTFSDPSSGASATLSSKKVTISAGAASVTAKADGTIGTYTVMVSAGYGGGTHFTLTNTAAITAAKDAVFAQM